MFDFIENQEFREILIRDFEEIEACSEINASKSVLVLAGSIIEAIFLEYFLNNPIKGKNTDKVFNLRLFELINEAEKIGLISERSKKLSDVVRDYRNYIHPGKEIRTQEKIDKETANIAFSLLKMIIKEVSEKYSILYGTKAETIYNKIQQDESAFSIFDKLIEKINRIELEKLTDLIVDNCLANKHTFSNRSFTFKYLEILKPKLDENTIIKFLEKLKHEVEHGDQERAILLFDLFGEKLSHLGAESVDLIIHYIYFAIGECNFLGDDLTKYRYTNVFQNLRLYNDKKEHKEKYMNLILSIVNDVKFKKDKERPAYIHIYKTLTKTIDKEALNRYISEKVVASTYEKFLDIMAGKPIDDLPF